jgi:hypothetical protein
LLPDYCAALPEQARETIDVPAKGKQPARKATVAMRCGPVNLKRSANVPDKDQPEAVSLWVVDVQEIDPPEGVERVHGRLLTTHTVTTLGQVRQIVAWYRMRWTIDIDQAWRLSRIKGWVGSICNEAFWVGHRGSVFSSVRIRAADRQAIADQRGRATPARRRGVRRARAVGKTGGQVVAPFLISVEAVRERVDRIRPLVGSTTPIFGAAIADHDWRRRKRLVPPVIDSAANL